MTDTALEELREVGEKQLHILERGEARMLTKPATRKEVQDLMTKIELSSFKYGLVGLALLFSGLVVFLYDEFFIALVFCAFGAYYWATSKEVWLEYASKAKKPVLMT